MQFQLQLQTKGEEARHNLLSNQVCSCETSGHVAEAEAGCSMGGSYRIIQACCQWWYAGEDILR